MRNKLGTIVFAQGWLEGQIESMVSKTDGTKNEDPTSHLIATQMLEQWNIISQSLDDLIREKNKVDTALSTILSGVEMLKG
jgi:hypothetical protein